MPKSMLISGENVGLVPRVAGFVMVPLMQFRRAENHAQRADGQTDV